MFRYYGRHISLWRHLNKEPLKSHNAYNRYRYRLEVYQHLAGDLRALLWKCEIQSKCYEVATIKGYEVNF